MNVFGARASGARWSPHSNSGRANAGVLIFPSRVVSSGTTRIRSIPSADFHIQVDVSRKPSMSRHPDTRWCRRGFSLTHSVVRQTNHINAHRLVALAVLVLVGALVGTGLYWHPARSRDRQPWSATPASPSVAPSGDGMPVLHPPASVDPNVPLMDSIAPRAGRWINEPVRPRRP